MSEHERWATTVARIADTLGGASDPDAAIHEIDLKMLIGRLIERHNDWREYHDAERRAHSATRAELDSLTEHYDAVIDGRDDLYVALDKLVSAVGDLTTARNEAATEIARFNSVLPVGPREVERQRNALKHRQAQIKAEALREAADAAEQVSIVYDQDSDDGWRKWMRERADAIERGAA